MTSQGARTNCNDMMMMATVTSSLYALYNKLAFQSFVLLQLAHAGWPGVIGSMQSPRRQYLYAIYEQRDPVACAHSSSGRSTSGKSSDHKLIVLHRSAIFETFIYGDILL